MIAEVTVLVPCGNQPRRLLGSLRSLENQTAGPPAVVLLTDGGLPEAARQWVEALARSTGASYVHRDAAHPGELRNAGLRLTRTKTVHFLDAGDILNSTYHSQVTAWLEAHSDAFVTTAMLWAGPGPQRATTRPDRIDLSGLLADTDLIHSATAFRRDAWEQAGGFDESLPLLEEWDFWLKLVASGHSGAVLTDALLSRSRDRDGLYRREWNRPERSATVAEIVGRHSASASPADVLSRLEGRLQRASILHGDWVRSRDRAVEEMASLTAQSPDLTPLGPQSRVIDLGDLRRTTPISRDWGYDRGGPVDRHYIEAFLAQHAGDIAGVVLEVQEPDYSIRFGGSRVTTSHVVDIDPANARATIVTDLRAAANIADDTYDCIIVTQTMHVIDDMQAVVGECRRILKPGGVLLATFPVTSRVCVEYGQDGDFWRVTEAGARHLFAQQFGHEGLDVQSKGNALVSTAFLYGLGRHEITAEEYAATDPYFPLLVTVRAVKPNREGVAWNPRRHVERSRSQATTGSAVLLYHRVATVESDVHRLAVPPEEFRQQVRYLADHYNVVPLSALADAVRNGNQTRGSIAITFDDGYVDNVEAASPVLRELSVPATFFVTTADAPEEGYWWDHLERLFLMPGSLPDGLDQSAIGGSGVLPTRTPDERLAAHWAAHRAIAPASVDARRRMMAALTTWAGRTDLPPSPRRATANDVRELASRPGHDIGAHSVHHLMLPAQPPEARRQELVDSKRTLEAALGTAITAFAYPFGACDEATRVDCRAAGYDTAVACDQSALRASADPLALPRLDVAARGDVPFDEWLKRHIGGPLRGSRATRPGRALVAGWFSYPQSDFTAGDLLARDVVCEWLSEAGLPLDVAVVPPFSAGVDLRTVDPADYTHAVFVCGPFMPNRLELEFVDRFRHCMLIGVNLSMPVPLRDWNPFDVLLERDSDQVSHPDITLVSREPGVPVVGVCLVEPYAEADTARANLAVERLLASHAAATVAIDTRLDINTAGLRSQAEVESLIAKMDLVVTTRLHGLVLALKHGVPAIAIDTESTDGRISRQARALNWPIAFSVEALDDAQLRAAWQYCLTDTARARARQCRDQAMPVIANMKLLFAEATSPSTRSSPKSPSSPDPAPPSLASPEA